MTSIPPGREAVQAPHAPLTEYYQTEQERSRWVRSMFDDTAPDYDRIEAILGLGTGSWYRRQALLRAGLRPGMKTVDVGMGTGLVARQIAAILGDPTLVTGVDPSPGMLQSARVPDGISLVEGSAEKIPFPDETFVFLSMGYALRHISDLSAAFAEFHRVLRPGARFCILEITCPESALQKAVLRGYLRTVVPLLARLTTRNRNTALLWRYYWDTIEFCVRPDKVQTALRAAGFTDVKHSRELGIFSEYTGVKAA